MKEGYPKRVGIELEDGKLSWDWVEAAKLTPKRKGVSKYPEGLPTNENQAPPQKKGEK